MNERTKKMLVITAIFSAALLTVLLSVRTALNESVYLPGYGSNNGKVISIAHHGGLFYVVPIVQAAIGLGFLCLGIRMLMESKK